MTIPPTPQPGARAAPARVAVTGAAGLVGAATVRRLVAGGARVLALVRPGGERWRLEGLPPDALTVAALDLEAVPGAGSDALARALGAFAPAALLHAGWVGIRGDARRDPRQTHNVEAAVAILRAAADAGVRRFVGIGSQAEYGPRGGPVREDDCPRPETLYGAAKLAAGHLCLALADRLGVSAAWVRAFSVYGPGERKGALLPDLARALAAGTPFPLSSCRQPWDYLHEDDAAEALARMLAAPDARGFFNLASGGSRPLADAVRIVRDAAAPGAELLFGSATPPGLEADVSRLSAALGWAPAVPLEDGIRRTVAAILGERR